MGVEVDSWWRQAVEDLDTAKVNLNHGKYYAASLFAQQAAEKALKALYILRFGELVRTHDLYFLGVKLDVTKDLLGLCESLSEVYLTSRYPDASDEIPAIMFSAEISDADVKAAEEVLKWVKERI